MKNLFKPISFLSKSSINELEKSSLLLEKKYSELKEKDDENKKIYHQLKRSNINLKKELKNKEEELKIFYDQITFEEKENYQHEIQVIEREIAGGFAHRLKNLYGQVILLINNINRNNYFSNNKQALLEIFNILKSSLPEKKLLKAIPIIEKINQTHKNLDEIFSISTDVLNRNMTIINNFLNYSSLKKSSSSINITELIENILKENKHLFLKYSIILKEELKYKGVISGDYEQFYSLIQNLINNAVKAIINKKNTQKANQISIKIYKSLQSEKQKKGFVLEISDTGIGIAKDNLNKIFHPFFTMDKKNGTGIGLSLCKRIVELYNGDITVQSREGFGTTFKIILPQGDN